MGGVGDVGDVGDRRTVFFFLKTLLFCEQMC